MDSEDRTETMMMHADAHALKLCNDAKKGVIPVREAQRVLDSLATGVLIFDQQLRLRGINSAAEALLSISARKAAGLRADQIVPYAPVMAEAIARSLEDRQPLTEREIHIDSPDFGEQGMIIDCTVTPLLEGPQPPEVLVELINVDRLHKIVREENLIAQQSVTTALLRGMAHEVKNPLGGIRGAAQLLERELTSEAHREYTRIIIGEVDRLRKLLDRMLVSESLTHKVRVNIHEILEHVRNLLQVEATGIAFTRDYDPSLPDVDVDRDQVVQAILNIVKNAVQAVNEGGEIILRTRAERQFTIGGHRHKVVIRCDVIDNGPGIPPELAGQIFYPMITGRPEGTGLGLAIAHSLVHRQGGMIECNSRPGRTQFCVILPAVSDE